ncbi:Queuosine Biosynthesis QueE Radical SAM [Paramagnetospirillum magnetotacticum MS-1]|uniref:7-carboxy-7-deazaguanine synthase n=1 Tax=Paramagnetospirillum magnetotacticum MS-1 TaxID=272627 RepID=A0A0C2U9G0_PARME|nr:7-carboxy-7-deazaguanine synthase [Paramagnetospirillum magnetotacticum]KIL98112.1 Queuosine Biosynthesis QueE Radical SAM [Paramagnetospirillum magnetotacticum MS-1]
MSYTVREIFHSLQGEGVQAGRAAVFLRFSGCNLWSGRQEDRAKAVCRFCDTDFVGGVKYSDAQSLAEAVKAVGGSTRYVVVTGGEPGLQLDETLIHALHGLGFSVAVETNGTLGLPSGLDWVCVSPKAGTELMVTRGDELKLVFPQDGAAPEAFEHLDFAHFLLQPMDGPDRAANTAAAIAHCLTHPRWRLSLQTHKIVGIP